MVGTFVGNAPMVGTFHAAGVSASYRWGGSLLRLLAKRLSVRCAVSADAAGLAGAYLGGTYEVLPNGVEVDRFAKATPWPTDGPTIFFVGRHEERKGLAVLLAAMERLPADVRLWVAGDGVDTQALQARTAGDPRIEWLGRVDDAEKARRMAGADVCCFPSLHGESFGVVLLEAMAAGTTLVASDLLGYAHVARADREALLVPPGDVAALAGALERALGDDALAERLVDAGLERAEELSMANLAARYLALYEQIV
jgi:phosphatidylinositol alpha-mannosyltransferase